MKISPKQYAESLLEVLAEAPKNRIEFYLNNFLKIVESNNDAKLLPEIAGEIGRASEEKAGFKKASITAAIELSEEAKKIIVKKLESALKAKIKLSEAVKPDILGGIIIEADNEMLDASARAWINKFKHTLSI